MVADNPVYDRWVYQAVQTVSELEKAVVSPFICCVCTCDMGL